MEAEADVRQKLAGPNGVVVLVGRDAALTPAGARDVGVRAFVLVGMDRRGRVVVVVGTLQVPDDALGQHRCQCGVVDLLGRDPAGVLDIEDATAPPEHEPKQREEDGGARSAEDSSDLHSWYLPVRGHRRQKVNRTVVRTRMAWGNDSWI